MPINCTRVIISTCFHNNNFPDNDTNGFQFEVIVILLSDNDFAEFDIAVSTPLG